MTRLLNWLKEVLKQLPWESRQERQERIKLMESRRNPSYLPKPFTPEWREWHKQMEEKYGKSADGDSDLPF